MTVLDHLHPIVNGTVILPHTIVTAHVAGHRVRLVVTDIRGDTIEGTELRRRHRPGGRVLIDTDGHVWERGNTRTVPAGQIHTVHRAREIDAP